MNVLITGGAGYIGSHAARYLSHAGYDVWIYDNLSTGHRSAVPDDRLIVGELIDTERLADIMRDHQISAVVHFAASALVGESVADPAKYYQNNVVATHSLLSAMLAAAVDRIVFSSTTATYGIPDETPIRESEAQRPINPYGFSKLVIEQMLRDYSHAYGLRYAALRYFNAAGASPEGVIGEDHDPESHLIPITLQVASGKRKHLTIFGDDYDTPDGTCVRDYVHVEDLATAHQLALEKLEAAPALELNLGTGRGHSVLEIVEACRRVTGSAIETRIGPRRPGDPPKLVADATKARKVLGWQPMFIDIDDVVETAWRWHRTHPEGYA